MGLLGACRAQETQVQVRLRGEFQGLKNLEGGTDTRAGLVEGGTQGYRTRRGQGWCQGERTWRAEWPRRRDWAWGRLLGSARKSKQV